MFSLHIAINMKYDTLMEQHRHDQQGMESECLF